MQSQHSVVLYSIVRALALLGAARVRYCVPGSMEDARLVAALEEGPPVVAMRIHGHENNNDDDDDLPVAVALGRQRHRDARARNREGHDLRRIMMMRGGPAAWRGGGGRLEGNANVEGNADNNVLWSLLQEGVHCSAHDLATAQGSCARVVERCLHHPADIHFLCQATGRTPLHEAALRCHCIHVLQALRQEDTQVFVLDRRGNTPLHLLLQGMATRQLQDSRLLALVEELLRGSPSSLAATANLDGYNALHLTCLGPEAMVPPSIVTRILRANPACASRPSRQGEFPLHLHCQRRKAASVQVAQMLLQAHPPALRVLDGSHGWTPLHYACAKLNTPLITLLLEADSGAVRQRSTQAGETPLHVLCRQKPHTEEHVRALRALLHVAPELAAQRDARPSHSVTPLHSLLQSVTIPSEAIQAVVEVAPAAVRVADSEGLLPLHVACHVGVDTDAVVALLQVDPQTAHAQTRKLDTPLSLACSTNRSLGTVRLLLEVSPESARVANDYGYCPLHCLVRTYQPSRAMALALLKTAPDILQAATNGGETPIHLLSNNGSASSSIFHDMSKALRKVDVTPVGSGGGSNIRSGDTPSLPPVVKTKIGNTPLHYACFRSAGREQIEALVMHHPEWLPIQNSGGFTPLQILCKSGRVDAELITLFARLGGPSIFSMVDSTGNTPLHSAVRVETDVAALQALIRACPKALQMRTIYEDTPLHLACLRQVSAAVVHEVATASCEGLEVSLANCDQLISPIFLRNSAGQTPISIAMEDNQKAFSQTARRCTVEVGLAATQRRAFDVLAILAKMLHYGPATMDEMEGQNLVLACVSLHRKNVRLDPTFIRRAILASPEQVAECDEEGNYPLVSRPLP
jgi:ankyrin repeat protein